MRSEAEGGEIMRLTNELLSAALSGLEYQKRGIEAKIAEIREELKVSDFSRNTSNDMLLQLMEVQPDGNVKTMLIGSGGSGTSTWRDRIPGLDAADLTSHGTSASDYPKRKHTMSAAGRARIAAAQKKRWAAIKKAKKAS